MRLLLTIFFVFTTLNSYALVKEDSYRKEIRSMLLKNHHPITDWKEAKKHLLQFVHLESDTKGTFIKDVYCGEIIRRGTGADDMPNGNIINVEHTWPQSKFPTKGDIIQKSDLHHLYPTDSKANSKRGNHPFGEFPYGENLEGCEISKTGDIPETGEMGFEPPLHQKGNVARALFYFSVRYQIEIPDYEEATLRKWHKLDPVDAEEIERNNRIEKVQGNRNIFIDEPEFTEFIDNF